MDDPEWRINSLKERAFSQPHVFFADLDVLRAEKDTGTQTRKLGTINLEDLTKGTPGESHLENLKDMKGERVDVAIKEFIAHNPEATKRLGIASIEDMLPAQAASLAVEIAAKSMSYAHELAPENMGKLTPEQVEQLAKDDKKFDEMTVDQLLLDEKRGVCRHMSKVAVGIYERLRLTDPRLNNTVLTFVHNVGRPEDVGEHGYVMLVDGRTEQVKIAIADPTNYVRDEGRIDEMFTEDRIASAINFLANSNMREDLGIPVAELDSVLAARVLRMKAEAQSRKRWIDKGFVDTVLATRLEQVMLKPEWRNEDYVVALRDAALEVGSLSDVTKNPEELFLDILNSVHLRGTSTSSIEAVTAILKLARTRLANTEIVFGDEFGTLLDRYEEKYRSFLPKEGQLTYFGLSNDKFDQFRLIKKAFLRVFERS